MRRFVKASMEDLERLAARASRGDGVAYAKATYPPGCTPRTGPLRLRSLAVGGFKLEVARGLIRTGDFRLGALFHSGSCVFSGVDDLARFFHGPVATSFGMEPEAEPAPPVADEPAETAESPTEGEAEEAAPAARASRHSETEGPPTPQDLLERLGRAIRGQDAALETIARIVAGHLAKVKPARPESILLIGPTGTGKTASVAALPAALTGPGSPGAHVFRVDCNELTDEYDAKRFLGAAPGLVGYTPSPPLVTALQEPGCIVLLDEIEKAHEDIRSVLLGLLDEGRVTAPNGAAVSAPGAIVAMTSNLGAGDLAYALRDAPDIERFRHAICRDHLLREGWPAELVGRIGAFAVFEELRVEPMREIAGDAIKQLAREYGLTVRKVPPVLADVVLDIAGDGDAGARALAYAARDLLGPALGDAARSGVRGRVALDPGPPPEVVRSHL